MFWIKGVGIDVETLIYNLTLYKDLLTCLTAQKNSSTISNDIDRY